MASVAIVQPDPTENNHEASNPIAYCNRLHLRLRFAACRAWRSDLAGIVQRAARLREGHTRSADALYMGVQGPRHDQREDGGGAMEGESYVGAFAWRSLSRLMSGVRRNARFS